MHQSFVVCKCRGLPHLLDAGYGKYYVPAPVSASPLCFPLRLKPAVGNFSAMALFSFCTPITENKAAYADTGSG